jgi:hypothetical protein
MDINEKIRHLRKDEQSNEEVDQSYINTCNLLLSEKVTAIDIMLNIKKINQINEDLNFYNWKE